MSSSSVARREMDSGGGKKSGPSVGKVAPLKRPNSVGGAGKFSSLWEEPGKLRKINFVVVRSSSEDEGYPATGLNYQAPDARGWQSTRFCLYPQTLVLQLEEKVCIRRLQLLSHSLFIPESMEVEVGDTPEGVDADPESAHFAKVGSVVFDTNEKSEYKSREFKTINLEAVGRFIKMTLHKNYDNRLNKFNQLVTHENGMDHACIGKLHFLSTFANTCVFRGSSPVYKAVGLLGINILGHGPNEEFKVKPTPEVTAGRGLSASENLSIGMDKDLTSAYDDLAYNMYMDPEIIELGRKLERRKQVAVRVERYEYARKLKDAQTALKLVGLKMGAMEMEKRIYMDNGQYDKAKTKARHKTELRDEAYAKLEIDTLLEPNGPIAKNDELVTRELPPAKRLKEKPKSPEPAPAPPPEDPLPTPPVRRQPLTPPGPAPPPPLPPKPAHMRIPRGSDAIILTKEMRDNMMPSPGPRSPSPPPLPPKTAMSMRYPDPDPDPEPDPEPEDPDEPEEDEVEPEPDPIPTPPREERRLPTRYQSYDDRRVTGSIGGGMMATTVGVSKISRLNDEETDRAITKLTEGQKKEAALPIEVFGIKTVSKIYDKQFNHKETGFKEVKATIETYHPEKGRPKAPDVLRAATMILQKGLKDNVMGIFYIGTEIMNILYGPFLDKNKIPKNDLAQSLDKIYPDIASKLSSSVPRQQSLAVQAILDAGLHPQVAATGVISRALTKPFPKNAHVGGGQYRAEMVEQLMDSLGVQKAKDLGLSAGELMAFASSGIQQPAEAIRKPCERIYVRLYKSHPKLVRKYLPIDENSARKNPSYKTLLMEFKRIDEGSLDAKEGEKNKKESPTQQTNGSVEAGPSKKTSAAELAPPPMDDRVSRRNSYNASPIPQPPRKKSSEEATCIFCGESSPDFVGEKMNLHYWKSCPMLMLCEHCKQVIEVSAIATHLLGECPASHRYKRCQYCGEAVKKKDYDSHVQTKPHPIAPPATQGNHCSLCHQNIGPWDEGWRQHLLGPNSCPSHDRKPNPGAKRRGDDDLSPPSSGTLSEDSGYAPRRGSRFPSISPSDSASMTSVGSVPGRNAVVKGGAGGRGLPQAEPTKQRHQSEGPARKGPTLAPSTKATQRRSMSEAPRKTKSKPWDRRTAW